MLVATLLALPNVFGEAPALQLSRNDRGRGLRSDKVAAVSATLAAKNIPVEASPTSKATGSCCASTSIEQQHAARDAIQARTGQRVPRSAVAGAAHAGLDARDRASSR